MEKVIKRHGLFSAILLSLALIAIASWTNAEPTTTEAGYTVEVSEIDDDFTYSASSMLYGRNGEGARLDWILFVPGEGYEAGTAGCWITIKEKTDAGPIIFYSEESDAGARGPSIIYFHGARARPVIDFSASSVGHDSSKVIFKLWPQQQ